MPTCPTEQTEACRRYYAAFPALKKGQESPLQYYVPPPTWCRKSITDTDNELDGQCQHQSKLKLWMTKSKKASMGNERRNTHNNPRKGNKKRCNSSNKSADSAGGLPEWMTYEGVWDMETQDPVKDFIRAIALDEGYGTCENTVAEDAAAYAGGGMCDNKVPDISDGLDMQHHWVAAVEVDGRGDRDREIAKFEAKFDRNLEALWSKESNTPDDEYRDLPIDFNNLLSSPSDFFVVYPTAEMSIWANDWHRGPERAASPGLLAALGDRFQPLNLRDADEPSPPPAPAPAPAPASAPAPAPIGAPFTLYEDGDAYDAVASVASLMHSYATINHSRDRSAFAEVPPRPTRCEPFVAGDWPPDEPPEREAREDLLTSSGTHFRPIKAEPEPEPEQPEHADGHTFAVRSELAEVEFTRSASGGVYLAASGERYLAYRTDAIDYHRLNLTAAQRCPDLEVPGLRLRFPLRQANKAAQTEPLARAPTPAPAPGPAPAPASPLASWAACGECGLAAKKMRPSGIESIWSAVRACAACAGPAPAPAPASAAPPGDLLHREWEELLADISAAHAQYAGAAAAAAAAGAAGAGAGGELDEALVSAERKRRHSAARGGGGGGGGAGRVAGGALCSHPHARFLHCCALALDRPLTR